MNCAPLLALLMLLPVPGDEPVVARAKGMDFSRKDYGEWLVQHFGVDNLDSYILSTLVQRMATERGLMPSDGEIEQAYKEEFDRIVTTAHDGNPESYIKDLAVSGYTSESWKAKRLLELRSDMAQTRLALAERPITEERLRSRYKDLFGDLGERVSLEVYFFSAYRALDPTDLHPDIEALKKKAHERAEAARAQLKAGAERPAVLATSEPMTSNFVHEGVVTGYRRNMLGQELDKALSSLDDPGDTSLVVDVFDGSYVLRLLKREPVRYEDVQEELVAAVRAEDVAGEELAHVRELVLTTYGAEKLLR